MWGEAIRSVQIGTSMLELVEGDITRQETEAIVNAANTSFLGGGGVDGAIHRAGGPQILEECKEIGGCPTAEARITTGGRLPARWVIHTVGPVYRDGRHREPELLASAYKEQLATRVRATDQERGLSLHQHGRVRLPHGGRGAHRPPHRHRVPEGPSGDPVGALRLVRPVCSSDL